MGEPSRAEPAEHELGAHFMGQTALMTLAPGVWSCEAVLEAGPWREGSWCKLSGSARCLDSTGSSWRRRPLASGRAAGM